MSDYTKTTNFAAKDSLPSGNSGKIVKGTEIDTEFNNIQTAVGTKLNTNNGALTGTTTFQTLSDGTIAITAFVDEDNMSSNSATLVPTQQSVKAYVDAQITAEDLDFQADSGGALSIDLDSETLTFTGGTGVDTSGSGNAVTFAIDSTVATLTGSQTLTNKTLTSPVLNTGVSGSAVLDEDNMASDSATHLATQQSIKAYVDSNVTAQDLDVTDGSSTIDIDLDSESLSILGGTGIDSTASGTGVTLAIDATVATLAGTQTLTNKTLTSPTLNTPTIGTSFTIGSATITEAELEILDGATVTTAELNVLDGITSTTAELNILDGVTSTAAELNILDGVTSTAAELNILDGVTSTTAELNILDGVTSSTAELNILDGVTSTAAELNILDGVTSTTAELNILDGVTATTTELNYVDGVTSAIQTQLDAKAALAGANFTGNVDIAGTLTTDAFSIEDATSPTLTLNDTTSANQKTTLSHTAGASVLTTGDNGVFGSFKIAAFDGTSTINRLLVADNGDVSLYEDGGSTAKLVWDSSAEALEFADNAKATFGAGDDLQIYHDGSDSFIQDTGTGDLYLQGSSNIYFRKGDGGEVFAHFADDGACKLRFDNSTKLATTAAGIDVTGTVTAKDLTLSDTNTPTLTITDTTNTTTLFLEAANLSTTIGTATDHPLKFDTNGTERMRLTSTGLVGIGTSSPTSTFRASIKGDYSSVIGGIEFDSGGGDKFTIGHATATSPSGTLNVVGAGNMIFKTNNTERMRIDSAGQIKPATGSNIGILQNLHVSIGSSATLAIDMGDAITSDKGSGIYMVSIVRTSGSYGRNFVGIFGVNSTSVILYETLRINSLTVTVSGTQILAADSLGGAVYDVNAIPLAVDKDA